MWYVNNSVTDLWMDLLSPYDGVMTIYWTAWILIKYPWGKAPNYIRPMIEMSRTDLQIHITHRDYHILLNWPIVSLLILFILFSMFFVLIHDYTLCFTGSPCCNFSHYNYIYIWPYYIVIHMTQVWTDNSHTPMQKNTIWKTQSQFVNLWHRSE